jgi:hypothetical protein
MIDLYAPLEEPTEDEEGERRGVMADETDSREREDKVLARSYSLPEEVE